MEEIIFYPVYVNEPLTACLICVRSSVSLVIRIICYFDDGTYYGTNENVYVGGLSSKYLCRYICSYKHVISKSDETC